MTKLLFALLMLVGSFAVAQKSQEPQKFEYLMYAERLVHGDTITGQPETLKTESFVVFYAGTMDVFTFNWKETLVRESKIAKNVYLCRDHNGELAIVSFLRTKKPRQLILAIQTGNKNYWLFKQTK